MELSQEEFDQKFRETLDYAVQHMAENPEVDVDKFYGMACFMENLAFFSPVLFSFLQKAKEQK